MSHVTLSSPPFIGFPIEARAFGGTPLTKNDWLGVYVKNGHKSSRLGWDWIKPPLDSVKVNVDWMRLCKGNINKDSHVTVEIKLYRGGGYFTDGTLEAENTITLRNPLAHLAVNCDHDANSVIVDYALLAPLPTAGIKIVTLDGVRLNTCSVPAGQVQGLLTVPMPRCYGNYEVSFLATNDTNAVLGSSKIEVKCNRVNTSYDISVVNSHSEKSGAAAVKPGMRITVACEGHLERRDEVVIIKGAVPADPKPAEVQHPIMLETVNGRDQLQIRAPAEEGIYCVCLGLRHQTGASLPGAYSYLLVSGKADTSKGHVPTASSSGRQPNEYVWVPPHGNGDYSGSGPGGAGGGGRGSTPPPKGAAPVPQQPPPLYGSATTTSAPPPAAAASSSTTTGGGGQYVLQPPPQQQYEVPPAAAPTPERFLCCVCRDNPVEMMVNPCHHLCVCETCSVALQAGNHPCPMCRQKIHDFVKVFI